MESGDKMDVGWSKLTLLDLVLVLGGWLGCQVRILPLPLTKYDVCYVVHISKGVLSLRTCLQREIACP